MSEVTYTGEISDVIVAGTENKTTSYRISPDVFDDRKHVVPSEAILEVVEFAGSRKTGHRKNLGYVY